MNAQTYLNAGVASIQKEKGNYQKEQYGNTIKSIADIDSLSGDQPVIYLLGCNDIRGIDEKQENLDIPHVGRIRDILYYYYNWHPQIDIVDLGDVKTGATLEDTYAALAEIFDEIRLKRFSKSALVLFGGSADQIKGFYKSYRGQGKRVEYVGINSILPILSNNAARSNSYLLDFLLEEDSYLDHYAHLAYQSYLTSAGLLENLDKFSFENIRLGQVKEHIDSLEPLFRNADMVSFDLRALAPTAYPMFHLSPTGLSSEEACRLMQFAGMATKSNIIHISNYDSRKDIYNHYGMAVAQMIWYAIDGFSQYLGDVPPTEAHRAEFEEYKTVFADYSSSFFKSKRSDRWWMLGPNKEYIACDYSDYEQASQKIIPEKWLRSISK